MRWLVGSVVAVIMLVAALLAAQAMPHGAADDAQPGVTHSRGSRDRAGGGGGVNGRCVGEYSSVTLEKQNHVAPCSAAHPDLVKLQASLLKL